MSKPDFHIHNNRFIQSERQRLAHYLLDETDRGKLARIRVVAMLLSFEVIGLWVALWLALNGGR